jgi:hypothetical protein
MHLTLAPSGTEITLGTNDFVAEGGEGKVYARSGIAYKIYHDPSAAPPEAKIAALARLTAQQVVRPESLLFDDTGQRVGHTMRHVTDAHPLCRLFTGSFRQRHGFTQQHALHLIDQLRTLLLHVHAAGVVVVDLNEMNILVGPQFDTLYLIDVESWQTPKHPATAILDGVRDRHATGFNEGTDWFAWAVVVFQLLIGVHPYKGKHPSVLGLDARMCADLSVLEPAVRCPPSARDFKLIPPPLRPWFERVFHQRHRGGPPAIDPRTAPVILPAVPHGRALRIDVLWRATAPILAVAEHLGTRCAITADGIWLNGAFAGAPPPGAQAIGFGGRDARAVVAAVHRGALTLWDTVTQAPIATQLAARAVTSQGGRIYVLGPDSVVELRLHSAGTRLVAAPRRVAHIRPHATTLFDGVAIQRAPGMVLATVFPGPGQALTLRLPDLADGRIVDAKADGGVLALLLRRRGRLHRYEVRFDTQGRLDLRCQSSVSGAALDLVVLGTGVAILRTDGDTLELFSQARGAPGRRAVQDPALTDELRLVRLGSTLGAFHHDRLYQLTLRA